MTEHSMKPTDAMAANARRELKLREKFGRSGTEVGVTRTRPLIARGKLKVSVTSRKVIWLFPEPDIPQVACRLTARSPDFAS